MKTIIIDRFENNYAICEGDEKTMIKIPKYKLPLECKEGDYLYLDLANMYQLTKPEQIAAENRIREKMNRLFED